MLGRQKKHLGDLSLQAGLAAEAWNYYQAYFLIICFIPSPPPPTDEVLRL